MEEAYEPSFGNRSMRQTEEKGSIVGFLDVPGKELTYPQPKDGRVSLTKTGAFHLKTLSQPEKEMDVEGSKL